MKCPPWIHPLLIPAMSLVALAWAGLCSQAAELDYYRVDDNAIFHFNKGQAWMEIRQYEAAIKEFQIGIRLKPTTTMTAALYNNMGLAYLRIGEAAKAIVSFQQATALNPNFSLYYEHLAEAYRRSGASEAALQQLRQATLTNPENVQAWYLRGVVAMETGQWDEAHEAFDTYVKLAPNTELADAARLHLERCKDSQTSGK